MRRSKQSLGSASALVAVTIFAAGCADSTTPAGSGAVRVTLQRIAAPSAQIAPALSVGGSEAAATPIDLDNVRCLTVQITGVHLLPVPPEDGDPDPDRDGGWIRLDVEPVLVDLMNLPPDPLLIAFDPEVPAGAYHRLRLITGEDNHIFFVEPFAVGQARYQGNPDGDACESSSPVTVPSGAQTGLKTDIALTVPDLVDSEPREVELVFDNSATIVNAVATGNGTVNLTPVFRHRP